MHRLQRILTVATPAMVVEDARFGILDLQGEEEFQDPASQIASVEDAQELHQSAPTVTKSSHVRNQEVADLQDHPDLPDHRILQDHPDLPDHRTLQDHPDHLDHQTLGSDHLQARPQGLASTPARGGPTPLAG